MLEGQLDSPKHINLHYDDAEMHYLVIAKLAAAMSRQYVCKACNKVCSRDVTHGCDQTCRYRMITPYAFDCIRIACAECSIHLISRACFAIPKQTPGRTNPFLNAGDLALRVQHS